MPQSETPQEASVETGLVAAQQPQVPTSSAVQPSVDTDAPAAEPAPSTEPISFDEPISATDLIAGVGDRPEDAVPLLTEAQLASLQASADRDNTKRDFTLRVLAARNKKVEPPAPPPAMAPRVVEQTRLEMEAGRKMNEHHAGLAVRRQPIQPQQGEKHEAVFRPADWVPDKVKGQGYNQARTLG